MEKSSPGPEVFPGRLKSARELRGLNQSELARQSGMQPSAVSHFETGARRPSFDNLRRLADALRVSTDFLLGRSEDIDGTADVAGSPLFRHYNQLTAEDQMFAEKMLKELAGRNKG